MTDVEAGKPASRRATRTLGRANGAFLRRMAAKDPLALAASIFLCCIVIVSLAAPLLAPNGEAAGKLSERLLAPSLPKEGSATHLLGTDQQGRDVLSRLIWGGRVSLTVGFTVVAVAGVFGTLMGLISGYFGGVTDMAIMRVVDVQSSFPGLLVALTFVMVLGPGERNLIYALTFNGWMIHARMARSQVLTVRESSMVEALRAIGCGSGQILFRHILPNVFSPLITTYVLEIAHMIIAECTMSFLGYGIQPPQASWGLMIGEGRQYITNAGWLVTLPGLLIALTVLSLNLLGNFVRSELDPTTRSGGR